MLDINKTMPLLASEISIAGFNALLDAAVDGIIITDHVGSILNINSAAQALFGYSNEEVHQKNVKILMPEPYKAKHDGYLKNYRDTANKKIIGRGRRVKAIRKDSSVFPIYLSVGEYKEEDKRYFIGIIRDLTEQLAAEDMAQKFRDRLAHVDRVSTMGEMASGIAHELNQPLTAIGSYVQACQRRIEQGEPDIAKISEILAKVEEQTLRASTVIERVRSLVRVQDTVREGALINDIVLEAVELATVDATSRGLVIEMNFLDYPSTVDVDTVQIQQVVLNLIRNAVDATMVKANSEGKVMVTTKLSEDGKSVLVQIRDWGVGISKQVQERLFHPFVSSKDNGTGLGLSISRSIIEAHAGKLWVEDESQGVTFQFSLPLKAQDES